jgi:hypothetical protein
MTAVIWPEPGGADALAVVTDVRTPSSYCTGPKMKR